MRTEVLAGWGSGWRRDFAASSFPHMFAPIPDMRQLHSHRSTGKNMLQLLFLHGFSPAM